MEKKLLKIAKKILDAGLTEQAREVLQVAKELHAAKGISPVIYETLKDCVEKGKTFEEAAKIISEKHNGWKLTKEDWEEIHKE